MPLHPRFRSLKWIEEYFLGLLKGLRLYAEQGDPWVFVCASTYIEYLTRIVNGHDTGGREYKEFLRDYFFKACPAYRAVQFDDMTSQLEVQMYHVLRCGIIHQFSLRADKKGRPFGGRDRSILLAHRYKNPDSEHLDTLVNRRTKPPLDSVILFAEDFVEDLETVTRFIFKKARQRTSEGMKLGENIRDWVKSHPPLGTDQIVT